MNGEKKNKVEYATSGFIIVNIYHVFISLYQNLMQLPLVVIDTNMMISKSTNCPSALGLVNTTMCLCQFALFIYVGQIHNENKLKIMYKHVTGIMRSAIVFAKTAAYLVVTMETVRQTN